MNTGPFDAVPLDERAEVTLEELAELALSPISELRELVECGVLVPLERHETRITFSAHCIVAARTARRLRDDFELDTQGVSLALALLERVRELEAEVRDLHARLPRHTRR